MGIFLGCFHPVLEMLCSAIKQKKSCCCSFDAFFSLAVQCYDEKSNTPYLSPKHSQ